MSPKWVERAVESLDEAILWETSSDCHIIRIPAMISPDRYREMRELVSDHPHRFAKDSYENYHGFSLQYSDDRIPYEDGVHLEIAHLDSSKPLHKDFSKWNEVGERLSWIQDALPQFQLIRGRVLEAGPGFEMATHRDEARGWRLHVPVITHPRALILIENCHYHLPADGGFYLMNVSKPHSVLNHSETPRTHLVFSIKYSKAFLDGLEKSLRS